MIHSKKRIIVKNSNKMDLNATSTPLSSNPWIQVIKNIPEKIFTRYDQKTRICLKKYFNKNKRRIVLDTNLNLHHDGYNRYGPKSDIYEYIVLFSKDSKIFYQIFHRENWFDGEESEFLPNPYDNNIFNHCLEDKLIEKGYYTNDYVQEIKIKLDFFNELIVEKILEFIINYVYQPKMLTFSMTKIKVIDLPYEFNLYLNKN